MKAKCSNKRYKVQSLTFLNDVNKPKVVNELSQVRIVVTEFAKSGLIQTFNFSNLTRHNSDCSSAIALKICGMNFRQHCDQS